MKKRFSVLFSVFFCMGFIIVSGATLFDPGLNWHSLQQIATNETGLVSVDADADSIIDNSESCDGDDVCEVKSFYATGKIGVGISNPSYQIAVDAGSNTELLRLESDWGQVRFIPYTNNINYIQSGNSDWTGSNELHITGHNSNNIPVLALLADKTYTVGRVGIGTSNPNEMLEVNGNVKANFFIGDGSQLTGITTIPSGMIAMFTTSCPSGWTRFNALDNRFPMGSSSYGSTGGSSAHSHSFNAGSHSHSYSGTTGGNDGGCSGGDYTDCSPGSDPSGCSGYSTCWVSQGHRHGYSGTTSSTSVSGTTGSASNLPPYIKIVFCRKN